MQKTPNWVKCSKCMQSTYYRRDWDPVKYGGQCSSHVQFLPVIVNVRQMLGYVTEFVHLLYDVGRKCSERLVIYCLNLHWTSLQSSHEIFRGCQDALDLHTKFRGALASSAHICTVFDISMETVLQWGTADAEIEVPPLLRTQNWQMFSLLSLE